MNETLQVLSRLYPSHPVSSLAPLSREALIKLLECQVESSNNDMIQSPASSESPRPSQPPPRCQKPILCQQQPLTDLQYLPAYHQFNQPMSSQQSLPDYHTFPAHQSPTSEQSYRSQTPLDQDTGSPPTQAVWFLGCGYILSEYVKPCGCTSLSWPGATTSCCNTAAGNFVGGVKADRPTQENCDKI
jgi:hypothetical protein